MFELICEQVTDRNTYDKYNHIINFQLKNYQSR